MYEKMHVRPRNVLKNAYTQQHSRYMDKYLAITIQYLDEKMLETSSPWTKSKKTTKSIDE